MKKREVTKLAWDKLETIDECVESATVDAYSDDEAANGWLTCIEEIFEGVDKVMLGDELVQLEGFDLSGLSVVARCRKGKKRIRVTLDSIEFINSIKVQKLWLAAWNKWQKDQGW